MTSPPLITLLTDFGLSDTYVGQVKGVILGINRDARLVDLSHQVPPQDILTAALLLDDAVDAFPPGTIHLVVVDPGVGSERRLLAAEFGDQRFVAPDNGLLQLVARRLGTGRIVELISGHAWRPRSNTFDGRDVLAPIAAHWSLGVEITELGSEWTEPLVALDWPEPVRGDGECRGEVVHVDAFGNLVTNLRASDLPAAGAEQLLVIELAEHRIEGLAAYYSEQPEGSLLALIGSAGRLEISLAGGSAANELDSGRGTAVRIGPGEVTQR